MNKQYDLLWLEQKREQLVLEIKEHFDFPMSVEVEINFHNITDEHALAIEARELDWYPDKYRESTWYTSTKLGNGSVTLFFIE